MTLELEAQNVREFSTLREHLGSYVRRCAGILVALADGKSSASSSL